MIYGSNTENNTGNPLTPEERKRQQNRESCKRWYKKHREYFVKYNQENRKAATERQRVWRAKNPEKLKQYYEASREERSAYFKELYRNNKEIISARNKMWKEANKDIRSKTGKQWKLKTQYGISFEKYQELLQACDNTCEVCGNRFDQKDRRPCVDHCHGTGTIRGILCNRCNTAEGMLGTLENSERLVEYMRKSELLYVSPKQPVPWARKRSKNKTLSTSPESQAPSLPFEKNEPSPKAA